MIKKNELTSEGKKFITKVCSGNGNSLLVGNDGILPYALDDDGNTVNKQWIAEPIYNGKIITTNNELGNALIDWFEKYGQMYNINPNFLAAQAYVESGYRIWSFDKEKNINESSTASGINRFTMLMTYSIIVNNFSDVYPKMWEKEDRVTIGPSEIPKNDALLKITNNLTNALSPESYKPENSNTNPESIIISKKNRYYLHQNIINNPEIMIKAQARYMRYISDVCNNLASASLFTYSRGLPYAADTYTRAIKKLKKDKNINNDNDPYLKAGLNYVLKIWGVLGDKDNKLEPFDKKYKPEGEYFGYNYLFNNDKDLNSYPNKNFSPFEGNVSESDEYGIDKNNLDKISIAADSRYKFIYFPENQYYRDEKSKIQIVLHHTVSGDKTGVGGDIKWWRDKGEKIATAFIISRQGDIYQLFNSSYWAKHLGIPQKFINEQQTTKSNSELDKMSIGIEIDSWGGLKQRNDGIWYSDKNEKLYEPNIQFYNKSNNFPKGFRGFYAFEKYTQKQINAVRDLILSLVNSKFGEENISLTYNEDMWDLTNKDIGCPNVSKNALNGNSGIWTHVSYRADKSDCHPQPELINMLKNLKGNVYNNEYNDAFKNYKSKK